MPSIANPKINLPESRNIYDLIIALYTHNTYPKNKINMNRNRDIEGPIISIRNPFTKGITMLGNMLTE